MENLWELIIFILFILGGSCSLAGTWWCKNKKEEKTKRSIPAYSEIGRIFQ